MRKDAKNYALTLLRTVYFMFAASALVWLVYNYASFNAVTVGLLGLGAVYGILTGAAALNTVRKGTFLSGSSIDVLSIRTQKLLRILGIAMCLPALYFCAMFGLCVASFDGTINAFERMKTVEGVELVVFGKSVIGRYIFGEPAAQPAQEPAPPTLQASKDIDFGPYMATLQRRIKRNWFPPKCGQSDRIQVGFTVKRDGTMMYLALSNPSKMAIANQAALKAVQAAAPFAALPEGSPESVDIAFTFDYNVFSDAPLPQPSLQEYQMQDSFSSSAVESASD